MVGLLDTNALIYLADETVSEKAIIDRYERLYISSITHIEFLGYNFQSEKQKMAALMLVRSLEIIHTNDFISQIAIQYRQKRKIKLPDAIILATASHLGAELCTANVDDFKNLDERVVLFNPLITKA